MAKLRIYKTAIAAPLGMAGSFIASLFGGWDTGLQTLLIFMGVNFLMGLILGGVFQKSNKSQTGALESRAGWKGLCRKGIALLIVLIAHRLDLTLGFAYIRTAVIIGFIANEALSIIKTRDLWALPLPTVITKTLEQLKGKAKEAKKMPLKGIDVSKHQGKINWQKVKAAGVEFAFIRAGYGMYAHQIDSCLKANMEGARAAGIPIGVYWYSYATTIHEAKQEAAICLQIIRPYKDFITLPVAYDWEDKSQGAVTADTTAGACKAFCDAVVKEGFRPMLYSFSSWLQTRLQDKRLDGIPRWVAHTGVDKPVCAKPFTCWQYSHDGIVDGISGRVDLNYGYEGLFVKPAGKTGWVQKNKAWYWYEAGEPVREKWIEDKGGRYFLQEDGSAAVGWATVDGKACYFAELAFAKSSGGRVKECQAMQAI